MSRGEAVVENGMSLSGRLHTLMCKLHGVAEWLRNCNAETLALNQDEVMFGQGEIIAEIAEEVRVIRDQVEKLEQ